jgi:hypothetical protein
VLGAHGLARDVVLEEVLVVVAALDLVRLDEEGLVKGRRKGAKSDIQKWIQKPKMFIILINSASSGINYLRFFVF